MLKRLLKYLSIVFLGLAGGMLWQLIILPYPAEGSRTRDLWFVKDFQERKVVVYPHKETVVRENEAVTEEIKRSEGLILKVESRNAQGSGLILTSDGMAVTLADLVPKSSNFSVRVGGDYVEAEVLKRDLENNLALLRVKKEGLLTSGFNESVEKGERVFLLGFSGDAMVANEGIVRYSDPDLVYTNIVEKSTLMGSVLFDIEGKVVGLNRIGLDNEVIAAPASRIRAFAGL